MKAKRNTALDILSAARQLFFEKGYEKATTREISERAGISNAAVYHHFRNKEEILYQICLSAADELIDNMRRAVDRNVSSPVPVDEQLKDIMLEYARTYLKNISFNKILLHEIEFLPSDKKRIVKDKETENVHQLRSFLHNLAQQGKIESYNPTVLTFSMISSLHWLYFWFRPDKGMSLEEAIGQIADIYLKGVLPRGGTTNRGDNTSEM